MLITIKRRRVPNEQGYDKLVRELHVILNQDLTLQETIVKGSTRVTQKET